MFLNWRDVANYRQQIDEVRQTSEDDYAIALMPIHQIQCLFSMQKMAFVSSIVGMRSFMASSTGRWLTLNHYPLGR